MNIDVNGKTYQVADEPDRPLLWVLRDELGLTGTKFGCGVGICGSCEVHLDGNVARSCITPLSAAGSIVPLIWIQRPPATLGARDDGSSSHDRPSNLSECESPWTP